MMIELTEGLFLNLDNVLLMEIISSSHPERVTGGKLSKFFRDPNYPSTMCPANIGDVFILSTDEISPIRLRGKDAEYVRSYTDEFRR
jgi:hypothetical protein